MFPTLPRIEMFARKKRQGWDRWGNEAPEGSGTVPFFGAPVYESRSPSVST